MEIQVRCFHGPRVVFGVRTDRVCIVMVVELVTLNDGRPLDYRLETVTVTDPKTPIRLALLRVQSVIDGQQQVGALVPVVHWLNEAMGQLNLTAEMESLCWSCFKGLNEDNGQDPYAERDDAYVASCSMCGHDMGE